jgi:hypothetical protein
MHTHHLASILAAVLGGLIALPGGVPVAYGSTRVLQESAQSAEQSANSASVRLNQKGLTLAASTTAAIAVCASDPLQAKQLAALANFEGWLQSANASGYVGEVGWPAGNDAVAWNALANKWYAAADMDQLWVTAWSAGEWWGKYSLQPYVVAAGKSSVSARGSQAAVLTNHPSTPTVLRGVNSSGGEFGTGAGFSNTTPGVLHTNYHYDSTATFQYLATQGVRVVRLPFRWERLQPRLDSALNIAAVAALKDAVLRANQAGLSVILDMQNFGRYVTSTGTRLIGTSALPNAAFADFWSRFASAFAGVPGVAGFDLMNEPHDLASVGVWQQASQQALTAVRAAGSKTLILVEGYDWAGDHNWSRVEPTPWIVDPAANFRYEAHQYFDVDWSGRYADSYATDVAAAQAQGYRANC